MTGKGYQVTCIILAGGKNARMGQKKAFLKFGEKTLIELQRDILNKIFEEIIVVANNLKDFKNVNAKIVKDIIPDSGPLGGLYSGLSVSSNIHSFLIGCDMPFINLGLIEYMIKRIGEYDIIIPSSSRGVEILFAIYSINCMDTIRRQIELRNLRLADILRFHKVRNINQDEISKFDPKEHTFFNVNNPKDYEVAKKIWLRR